jgi:hypothetical protein
MGKAYVIIVTDANGVVVSTTKFTADEGPFALIDLAKSQAAADQPIVDAGGTVLIKSAPAD